MSVCVHVHRFACACSYIVSRSEKGILAQNTVVLFSLLMSDKLLKYDIRCMKY